MSAGLTYPLVPVGEGAGFRAGGRVREDAGPYLPTDASEGAGFRTGGRVQGWGQG